MPHPSRRRVGLVLVTLTLLGVLAPASSGIGTLDGGAPIAASSGVVARQAIDDVTDAKGLAGYLHAGFLGDDDQRPKFIEMMGAGACWLDADGDGLLDLFLVNGRYHTEPEKEAALQPTSRLYRNTGAGFVDITATAGVGVRAWGQGCAAADYDNDGRTDLYVTTYGANFLFRNTGGGAFADVTAAAGVAAETCGDFPCWSSGATWFDADLDGCLDLYVNNFADWTFETPGGNGPGYVAGQGNLMFAGACGGAFTDVTAASGFHRVAHTWSSVAYDLDLDGWPDLYDSNDMDPNDLWLNNGDGTFRLVTNTASDPRAGMGTAIGDLNRDGRPDIVTTNYAQQTNGVFLGRADGGYDDIGDSLPFRDARPYSGWATNIYDYDHDTRPDLMVVNSMPENFTAFQSDFMSEQPVLLYRQLADGTFAQANSTLGAPLQRNYVGRGVGWADYDNDGDVDMLLVQAGESPVHLLRTERAPGNSLTLDLAGTAPGVTRDAIGARVTVSAGDSPAQVKEKAPQMGFLSTNDPRLHFGLGEATRANVTVRWPDGTHQTFANVSANAFLRLEQGAQPVVVQQRPLAHVAGSSEVERLVPGTFHAGLDVPLERAEWEFGDGSWARCEAGRCLDDSGAEVGTMGATSVQLSHAFASVGTHEVHVALTDAQGRVVAKRMEVDVTAALLAELAFTRRAFGMSTPATGSARVTFEDGTPVAGANVQVTVNYSFWKAPESLLVPQLPRSLREAAGYRTEVIEGTTESDGTFAFAVPLWWRSPIPAAPVAFNPMGDYTATLTGSFRHSLFGPVEATYQVLPLR